MSSDLSTSNLCLNCGTPLAGKFCHVCGQKRIEDKERTLTNFIYQFFGATFFLENNFLKNLWYLLTRPGFLAKEFVEGRHKRYMPPLSLFLLINLVYFFFVSLNDLNLPLTDQLYQPQHGGLARTWVNKRLVERNIEYAAYAADYNEASTSLSKTLIILHTPILAGFLMLLYWKRNYFFADHMIFSLYLMGFILLLTIIIEFLRSISRAFDFNNLVINSVAGYMQLAVIPTYFFLSVRRFYNHRVGRTILSSISLMIFFLVTHFVYRSILFFTVFWIT